MHKARENGDRRIWAVVVLLAGAVFTFDVLIPLGVAGAVPYVAVVLVSLWAPRPRQTILWAAGASALLTILGYYFSPQDGIPWMVALNRLLTVAAVWVTAILALWHEKSKQAVQRARDELEDRVQQRTTELRHLNEKLREETVQHEKTQQQFHDVVESAPDAIVLIDSEGNMLIANAQTEALFGFSRDEMLRQPVEMLMPQRYRKKHVLQRLRYARQPAVRPTEAGLELFGRKKNGNEFPIEISLSTVDSPHGVLYAAMIRDVTGRKQAEQLLGTRERQQAVVATLGQVALAGVELDDLMVMLVDRVAVALKVDYCKILQLLPSGEEFLLKAGVGWKEGLVGRATIPTGRDSQAGYTLHSSEPVIVDDLRKESRFAGPALLSDHGVVSGLSVIIPGADGPYGVLGVHSNERRAFSDDDVNFLRATANLLADAVQRRGAEDRLRQLQTELAHLSRVSCMGEMAAGIAHEVNQPLHAIANCAVACAKTIEAAGDDSGDKVMAYIREISKQASNAGEIIRGMTKFVRQGPVRRGSVDVSDAVREALILAGFEAQRHGTRIETRLENPLPQVLADRIQVQQVLLNLVRNACEAMSATDAADRVVTISASAADGLVKVSVADNGPGFPPGECEKIFETFYSTKPDGMGMGLAISRTIVEAHRGRLWADENTNRGVSFHFTLPTVDITS